MTHSMAMSPALARHWYPVALADSVGEAPQRVEVLEQAYVVWRSGDAVVAHVDRCPHREAPLSAGRVQDGCLVCPYHGWAFDADGACVRIPSQADHLPIVRAARAPAVHCVERYGLVWVCPGEPAYGIVEVVEDLDPAYRRINCSFEVWNASASRLMDNFVDYSHFPFTHAGSFGGVMDAYVPTIHLDASGDLYSFSFDFEAANPEENRTTTRVTTATVTRTMTHAYGMPFTIRNVIAYETGLRHVVLIVLTPVDDQRTIFTMTIFRNDDHAIPVDEAVQLDRKVVAEDRRMMELIPGPLPLDPRQLLHVHADRPAVDWARRFAALLESDPAA
jgi:phenylpropionate dioxygenase-like ring-hydroxylating dioxygenase large terminal subunit